MGEEVTRSGLVYKALDCGFGGLEGVLGQHASPTRLRGVNEWGSLLTIVLLLPGAPQANMERLIADTQLTTEGTGLDVEVASEYERQKRFLEVRAPCLRSCVAGRRGIRKDPSVTNDEGRHKTHYA